MCAAVPPEPDHTRSHHRCHRRRRRDDRTDQPGRWPASTSRPAATIWTPATLSADLVVSQLPPARHRADRAAASDTSAQARAGRGYARADFRIDYDARTVTCPHGATSALDTGTKRGKKPIVAHSRRRPRPLPGRGRVHHQRHRRQLTLLPRDLHDAQAQARSAENDRSWQADYARRAGVEGTMQQAVATCARRARYRGLAKTRLEHTFSATALNMLRLEAFWNGPR